MKISIVINTLNRANCLKNTLHSLQYLDYKDYEVIVVNGPSTDHTQEILNQYKDQIKIGHCSEKNLSISRNIGVAMAAGEIVAFLDDDAIPEPEWLTKLITGYDSDEVAAVGGSIYDNTGYTFQLQHLIIVDRIGRPFVDKKIDMNAFPGSFKFPSFVGANSSFRRSLLLEVGGFDEQYDYYLDETDVCVRLIDAGYNIKYAESCYVHHKFAPSSVRKKNAFTNWYSIIKNLIYYIHKNYLPYFDDKSIPLEYLLNYINLRRSETIWNYENKLLTEEEFKVAINSILDGMEQGFIDAKNVHRKLIQELTLKQHVNKFKKYVTRFNLAEKKVICLLVKSSQTNVNEEFENILIMARNLANQGHYIHMICCKNQDRNTVDYEEGVWIHTMIGSQQKISETKITASDLDPILLEFMVEAEYQELMKIKEHHGKIDQVWASNLEVEIEING